MKFGVSFDGGLPPDAVSAMAQAADQAGAGTLWVASHLFQREPIVNVAMMLNATNRISAALMAMSPYTMHPVHITMAAAALDEWFPGRVTLCFGVGAPRDLAAVDLTATKPLKTISESIAIARDLLAGKTVGGRRLSSGPRHIPIMIAASGPKMLELAGAQADGVVISAATSPAFIAWALSHVAAGEAKTGRRIHKAALVSTGLGQDARRRLRRGMGFILRGGHHARNLELARTRLDQSALATAYAAEDWPTVEHLIDEHVLDNHTASGTIDQITAALDRYAAVGLDEVVLAGVTDPADMAKIIPPGHPPIPA